MLTIVFNYFKPGSELILKVKWKSLTTICVTVTVTTMNSLINFIFFRSVSWDGSYSIWSNNLCYGWKIMNWVSPLEFLRTVTVSKKLNVFSINPYSPHLLG